MVNSFLTAFSRDKFDVKADFGEKIGNVGLGLLRIGFGKTVSVENISDTDQILFENRAYSTSTKVAAVALCIFTLPLTIVLAGIGCIGTALSKSHEQIFNSYCQSNSSKQAPMTGSRIQSVQTNPVKIESTESSTVEKSIGPQERRIPPISTCDTIIMRAPGEFVSVHGSGELFSDTEIVEKLDVVKKVEIGAGIHATYTRYGKAIIQQQATRGCTAATAAMLIMDNDKLPDINVLSSRNLGNDDNQLRDLEKAGLKGVINSAKDLSELRILIGNNGSAIVSVSGKLGGHVVVVDEVSGDLSRIRLRDPYHGWEITVTSEAFLEEWNGGKAIQIDNS